RPLPRESQRLVSGLPLPWLIAGRYLRGERSHILSSTGVAALAATTLGVLAMTIAMALMSGYTETLQRKLIGLQGDLVVSPLVSGSLGDGQHRLRRASIPGVEFVGQVAYGEGSISSPALRAGTSVVFRGVEPGSKPPIARTSGAIADPKTAKLDLTPDDRGVARVLVGQELMRRLQVQAGDTVRLVVLDLGAERPRFRYRSARIAGAFTTGFAEFDASWALLDRDVLLAARGTASGIDVLEVKIGDGADREEVAASVEDALGEDWHVQRWEQLNRDLFAALALQEALLFFVLGLIVVVSTFNTASTLVILVRERLADIGVLTTLGLEPRRLFLVFLTYGLGLGALGIALGVTLGTAISWVVTRYELVRFDPEVAAVYFIDSVPFITQGQDVAAIVAFSFTVTVIACSIPAARAAKLLPAQALRGS
ncbi:MAG: FtsX-like permease family protein, partial [Acidobacteriota bacterium]